MKEFNFDIWRLQTQSNVRGLLDALKNSDPALRQRAAMALRVMGSASALPALQDALLTETDKETRDIIIATLETLFSQEHEADTSPARSGNQIVQFIARLNSANTEHAVRAAQGLGDIQEKLAVEALMVTFNNRQLSARVRLAAAEALIRLQSATADMSLLAALRSERWSVRRSAAAVLGQMDADWAVEPLIKALQDPYEIVRRTARAALDRIATPEAKRALEAISDVESSAPETPPAPAEPAAASAELPPSTAVTPASSPAAAETKPDSQTAINPDATTTEPAPVSTPEEPPAAPSTLAPTASLTTKTPPPETKTPVKITEPAREPSGPSVSNQPPPILPPTPSSGVTVTDSLLIAPAPIRVEAALDEAAASTVSLTLPANLPPPTEEDTRPMTPVPDDVS